MQFNEQSLFTSTSTNYILYAHDDMFFCKNWDIYLTNEIKNIAIIYII